MDKVETLMKFALSVQNLYATLEASSLEAHLNNPVLLQNLIDKLPTELKYNWAMYKRQFAVTTLSSYNEWLTDVAQATYEVNIPTTSFCTNENKVEKHQKDQRLVHIHTNENSTSNRFTKSVKSKGNCV